MGNRRIVVDISFNCYRYNGEGCNKEWIDYRISIFMKYTLRSLQRQTNSNFLVLVRYLEESEELIQAALGYYKKLPDHIKFVNEQDYMKPLEQYVAGYDEVYFVRLDSDDMYHKSFVQQLHDYKPHPSTQALINPEGYMYDAASHHIAAEHHSTPSCYTLIYKTTDFLQEKRYKLQRGHRYVMDLVHEIINKPMYIRVIHDHNTMITFILRGSKNNKIKFYHYNLETNPAKVKAILNEFM